MKKHSLPIMALLLGGQLCFANEAPAPITIDEPAKSIELTEGLPASAELSEALPVNNQLVDVSAAMALLASPSGASAEQSNSSLSYAELSDEESDQVKAGVYRFALLSKNQKGLFWPGVIGVFGGIPAATFLYKLGDASIREMAINTLCGSMTVGLSTVWGNSQLSAMAGDNQRTYDIADQGLSLAKSVVIPIVGGGCLAGLNAWAAASDNAKAENTRKQIGDARNEKFNATGSDEGRRKLLVTYDKQAAQARTYLDNIEFYTTRIATFGRQFQEAKSIRRRCFFDRACDAYYFDKMTKSLNAMKASVKLMETAQRNYMKVVKKRSEMYGMAIRPDSIPRSLRLKYVFTLPPL